MKLRWMRVAAPHDVAAYDSEVVPIFEGIVHGMVNRWYKLQVFVRDSWVDVPISLEKEETAC